MKKEIFLVSAVGCLKPADINNYFNYFWYRLAIDTKNNYWYVLLADMQGIIDIGWLKTVDTTKSCTD
jgi:hypothetical protein